MGKRKNAAQPRADMLVVAHWRLAGLTWDECAQKIGKASNTLRHWPSDCADDWARAMRQAIDDALPDYEARAIKVVGGIMDNGDTENIRLKAGGELMRHSRELRGMRMRLEVSGPEGGPISYLQELGDAELDRIVEGTSPGGEDEDDEGAE